jgi:hypothetical protein
LLKGHVLGLDEPFKIGVIAIGKTVVQDNLDPRIIALRNCNASRRLGTRNATVLAEPRLHGQRAAR